MTVLDVDKRFTLPEGTEATVQDPFYIHRGLGAILLGGIAEIREAVAGSVGEGRAIVEDLLDSFLPGIEARRPLDAMCAQRRSLEKVVPVELWPLVKPIRDRLIQEVQAFLSAERNPQKPLNFDVAIPYEISRFPESPWMQILFDFADPASGVTEGPGHPHYFYLRLPKPLEEGEDLSPENVRAILLRMAEESGKSFLLRIHSRCECGDGRASQSRCSCGGQYDEALEAIEKNQFGAVLYLQQEGRGIDLLEKSRAHALVEGYNPNTGKYLGQTWHDTDSAMREITGHDVTDMRRYEFAMRALLGLGLDEISKICQVPVITNNRMKVKLLEDVGILAVTKASEHRNKTDKAIAEDVWKLLKGSYKDYESAQFLPLLEIVRNQIRGAGRFFLWPM